MSSGRRRGDREKDHVYCFVPGEGIDVFILAAYLKRWIDGTATIEPSRHPRNPDRLGFNVGASNTLSREALEDLLEDTAKWQDEQNTREFQKNPYDYIESDTFNERKRRGPTRGDDRNVRLAKPRTKAGQPESHSMRSSREEPARNRQNTDIGSDRPPEYSQVLSSDRPRQLSRSPSPNRTDATGPGRPRPGQPGPRPPHPHPVAFGMGNLTLDEEQPKPNQRAGGNSGRHDSSSKSYGKPAADEQVKRGNRHGEAQY
ncbi:hypothetical protein DV736_g5476, partial [Chaetothyriales sp. CBS 134916]